MCTRSPGVTAGTRAPSGFVFARHAPRMAARRQRECRGGPAIRAGSPQCLTKRDGACPTPGLRKVRVLVTDCFGDLMKRLVEFPLEAGGGVLVEIDEASAGATMRGLGKDRTTVAERADKTFEEATATVIPAADSLLARLRGAHDPADEISIEFGVQLNAQTGAFIASAAVGANFKVSMTWRHGPGA